MMMVAIFSLFGGGAHFADAATAGGSGTVTGGPTAGQGGGVGGAAGAMGAAPAAGASSASSTTSSTSGNANSASSPTTASTATNTGSFNGVSTFNSSTLPPPPPSTVNSATITSGVPPTPAPATPGLPEPSSASGALPSQQGFSAQVNNELRPSPSLNVDQVTSVQAALAAGGLYRGPVDGNLTASTRAAVRLFQQIQRLPETGELDGETVARLQRSAAAGSVGSNGATATVGNRAAAGDPFSVSFTGPPASVPSTTGTATFSTPFRLASPINTSPVAAPGIFVQP